MYSRLLFVDERQVDSLRCKSPAMRSRFIESYVIAMPIKDACEVPGFEFTRHSREAVFDYLETSFLLFVSSQLAEFLREKINAEFLSVDIEFHNGAGVEYKIMHLLENVQAMDRQESRFSEHSDEMGGGVCEIRKLVLDTSLVAGKAAFILAETHSLFFRNDLCREIEVAGFRGLRFQPSEEMTFG